jgi:hypothetical protein
VAWNLELRHHSPGKSFCWRAEPEGMRNIHQSINGRNKRRRVIFLKKTLDSYSNTAWDFKILPRPCDCNITDRKLMLDMENNGSSEYHTMDTSAEKEESKIDDERKRNRRHFCYFLTTTLLFLAVSWVATIVRVGTGNSQPAQRRLAEVSAKEKILYIVTTLAEYNSGSRSTVRGSDRLQETLIPVLSEGVRSMLADGYEVDGT